jgi:hypothetical protein
MADRPPGSVRRRVEFHAETWHALHRLSLDSMRSLQELADEAFRDLLKKHRRPVSLKDMLRESARTQPANDHRPLRKHGYPRLPGQWPCKASSRVALGAHVAGHLLEP